MGTETHLHVLNNQRLKGYLVKLNNPRIGTEIRQLRPHFFYSLLNFVKLNNPLMGAEKFLCQFITLLVKLIPRWERKFTAIALYISYRNINTIVKLNNPHKGSEEINIFF